MSEETIGISTGDGKTTIQMPTKFSFSLHQEFREVYEEVPEESRLVLDLARTKYLDSSALGMLLLLREHFKGDVELVNANGSVMKILKVANFDKLFTVV